jgi:molybdate transport system substrate-binding protein
VRFLCAANYDKGIISATLDANVGFIANRKNVLQEKFCIIPMDKFCTAGLGLTISLIAFTLPVSADTITAFIGSATKPAMEETLRTFSRETNVEVIAHYGGSGNVLSQMKISGIGDIYFPGSPDFMEKAKQEGLVDPGSIKTVAYLVPAINVATGNKKNIQSLCDLTKDGVNVVIANPRVVCVGLYAIEIFEANGLSGLIKPRIKSYTESCARTANTVAIGGADAVMGWRVFEHWNPERIETVLLKPEQIPRIAFIPIAITTFSKKKELADKLITFVTSPDAKAIFKKWGYLTEEKEALAHAPQARIGGEYVLPEGWQH